MEFDGAFDAVISLGTTFGFFDEESNRDVLARLYHALRPGGRLLIDVVNRDYVAGLQPNLVWFEGDDCVCMEESDFNYFNSRLSVKRTMMREDGRQSNAEYSLRLYSLHELGHLMQQLGLRVIEVSGQEAIRGAFFGSQSPRILMLAERRVPPRTSTNVPSERGSVELAGRASLPFSPERASSEVIKPPKPE
jgi:SAM-dependent methyltransferase